MRITSLCAALMFFLVGNAWSLPAPLSPEQLADLADLHIVGEVVSVECTGPAAIGDDGAKSSFYRAAVLVITLHDGDAAEGDVVYTDFERKDWMGNPPLSCGSSGPPFPQGLIAEMYLEETEDADAYKSVHWNAVSEIEGSDPQELPSCEDWTEPTDTGSTEDAGGSTEDAGGSAEDAGGSTEDAGGSAEDAGGSTEDAGGSTEDAGGSTEDAGGSTEEISTSPDEGPAPADAEAPAEDTGSPTSSSGGCSVGEKPVHGPWLMMTLLLGLGLLFRRSRTIRA